VVAPDGFNHDEFSFWHEAVVEVIKDEDIFLPLSKYW
jgi:hypothetical protein